VKATKSADLLQDAVRHMNDGKYSRAFALLKDLLKRDPSHQEGRRLLASLLLKFGNLATARSAFDALVKEAIQRKDFPEAEALLREYLASGPRCVPFLEALGHVYELKGDPYAAVFEYEKAVDVLLDDPDPDRPGYAQELYAKISQLAPSSFVANRVAARFKETPPSKAEPLGSDAPPPAVRDSEPEVVPADMTPDMASSSAIDVEEPEQELTQEAEERSTSSDDADAGACSEMPADGVEQPVVQTAIPQQVGAVRDRNDDGVPFPPVNQPLRLQEGSVDEEADEGAAAGEEGTLQEEQSRAEFADVKEPLEDPRQPAEPLQEAVERRHESLVAPHPSPEHADAHAEVRETEQDFPEPLHQLLAKEPEPVAAAPIPTELVPDMASSAIPVHSPHPHSDSMADSNTPVPEAPEWDAAHVTPDPPAPMAPAAPIVHFTHADMRMAEPPGPPQEGHPAASTSATCRETAPMPKRRKSGPTLGRAVSTWVGIRVSIVSRKVRALTNSVTKLTVFLSLAAIGAIALLVVAAAVGWLLLDQKASERFTTLDHVTMPKALDDPKRNGYILILGIDADEVVDALQAGYDRWLGGKKESDEGCTISLDRGSPSFRFPTGCRLLQDGCALPTRRRNSPPKQDGSKGRSIRMACCSTGTSNGWGCRSRIGDSAIPMLRTAGCFWGSTGYISPTASSRG
jgi:tetratricopeptide (TPR) repeat protein